LFQFKKQVLYDDTEKVKLQLYKLSHEPRVSKICLAGLLLLAYPMSRIFPVSFGGENGPIEIAEELIIGIGLLLAVFYSFNSQDRLHSRFWLISSSFWLIMLGQKLSWDDVFYFPLAIQAHGLTFPSHKTLGYGPEIYYILVLILIINLYIFFKYHLRSLIVRLWRDKEIPLFELVVALIAIIIAYCSERHLLIIPGGRNMVLGEYAEAITWLSLLSAQMDLITYIHNRDLGS
jgi:hypothetical protein